MMETVREIPLSRGLVCKVDADDYERLSKHKWSACAQGRKQNHQKFRAVRVEQRDGRQKSFFMHRVITGAGKGEVVDHINGDPLDNRRCNLRVCDQKTNATNRIGWRSKTSTKFKGVHWHKGGRKWMAMFRGKYLGLFADEIDAAKAYDEAAKASGDLVPLNLEQGRVPSLTH